MKDELQKALKEFWLQGYVYGDVPAYLHEGILRYVCDGVRPGEFLTCVFKNDLRGASRCGTQFSNRCIPALIAVLEQFAPEECWGSEGRFNAWLFSKRHGIR